MNRHLTPISLIFITFFLFLPVCGYEFLLWDDNVNIFQNRYLNPPSYEHLKLFWTEPFESLYIPLTYTVWSVAAFISRFINPAADKLDPTIFHSFNFLFHLINFFLVFSIIKLLIIEFAEKRQPETASESNLRYFWAASAGALFYSVHPVQVEVVSWATGMKDLLCTLFSFLSILLYLFAGNSTKFNKSESESKSPIHKKQSVLLLFLASLAYLAALLSKPTAVIVPVVVFTLSHWLLKRPFKKSGYLLCVWLGLALIWVWMTKSYQPDYKLNFIVPPLWDRLFVAGDTLAFYLFKLFFPLELTIDYSRFPGYVLLQKWVYFTSAVPVIFMAGSLWIRKNRVWSAGVVVFFVGIAPVSGIVPFEFQNYSTVADRYTYFAMLGPSIIMGWLLASFPKKWLVIPFSIFLCLLIVKSFFQIKHWKNSETLFEHALSVNPFSYRLHNNLAIILAKKNKTEKAISHYEAALKINPSHATSHYNLANILRRTGQGAKAVDHFHSVLRTNPYDEEALFGLASVLKESGRSREALTYLKQLVTLRPEYPKVHNSLGAVLSELGNYSGAIERYREAIRLKPDYTEARNSLGLTLVHNGMLDEGIQEYKLAIKSNLKNPAIHNNLAIAYVNKGEMVLAEKEYKRALKLDTEYAEAHNNLAINYIERGLFEKALEHINEALRIHPKFADAVNSMGEYFLKKKEYESALIEFKRAISIEPAPYRQWNAALAAEKSGKLKEAIFFWKEFLKWESGHQDDDTVRAHIRTLVQTNHNNKEK